MEYATSTALNLCCYFCASKHENMKHVLSGCCFFHAVYMNLFITSACVLVFLPALKHLNVLVEKNLYNNLQFN